MTWWPFRSSGNGKPADPFAGPRAEMVREQLADRGITDARVLAAMGEVPRHRFVPAELLGEAYADRALSIKEGQTISQPYMVGLMTAELRLSGGERVLEIGTGSGYQTAVLARLAKHVYTVERHEPLSRTAKGLLDSLGVTNVSYFVGDGTLGRTEHAPFDRILVTAGGPEFPKPLLEQLAVGGRLLAPLGPPSRQMLTALDRFPGGRWETTELCPCVFVPLLGRHGRKEDGGRREDG
jgi:protein-L-isoaspartate(D-aspartate) O-methyltransferase